MAAAQEDAYLTPVASRALRARTVTLVVLASLICAVVPSLISIHATYARVRSQLEKASPALVEQAVGRVRERVEAGQTEVAQLAASGTLARALQAGSGARAAVVPQALGEALDSSQSLEALVAVDPSGDVIGFAGAGAALDHLLETLQPKSAIDAQLEDAMRSTQWRRELGQPEARLRVWETPAAAPLPLASVPVGAGAFAVIHGLIGAAPIESALLTELPEGVSLLELQDADGAVVARTQGEGSSWDAGGILDTALAQLGGAWSLRYSQPLELLGWNVALEGHLLGALRDPALAAARGVLLTLVLAGFFGVVAYYRSTRMLRPLWALYEAMLSIGRGQPGSEVPTRGASGEAESLIRAFNALYRRFELQRTELEQANRTLSDQNQVFQEKQETLSRLTVTDSLTQLANRRFFEDQLNKEIKRLARSNEGLSMLVIDIDDFKKLNDSFGHAAGDEFLRQIAKILAETVRSTDLVARYGGEEFVVVAPATPLEGAEILAEKLRTAVAEASFIVDDSMRPRRATISVGVAEYSGSQTNLFNSADAALYEAKQGGKNCVMVAPAPATLAE